MAAMRLWLDEHLCDRARLTCDRSPGWFVIGADFDNNDDENALKRCFGGSEAPVSGTMAKVCWWRLMAEEIRAEADDFASTSAKGTMLSAARTLERMARDLE